MDVQQSTSVNWSRGENKDPVPDPLRNNKDLLLEDIAKFERNANRDDTPD